MVLFRALPACTTELETKAFSQEAEETLQGCFSLADWEVLCSPWGENIDSLTYRVSSYIKLCGDTWVHTKTMLRFLNNKPGVSKDIKAKLDEESFQERWQEGVESGSEWA